MITVTVKQMRNGYWCCYTTYKGYDISVQAKLMHKAIDEINLELSRNKCSEEISFSEPIFYVKDLAPKRDSYAVGYGRMRIDNNPIA